MNMVKSWVNSTGDLMLSDILAGKMSYFRQYLQFAILWVVEDAILDTGILEELVDFATISRSRNLGFCW